METHSLLVFSTLNHKEMVERVIGGLLGDAQQLSVPFCQNSDNIITHMAMHGWVSGDIAYIITNMKRDGCSLSVAQAIGMSVWEVNEAMADTVIAATPASQLEDNNPEPVLASIMESYGLAFYIE